MRIDETIDMKQLLPEQRLSMAINALSDLVGSDNIEELIGMYEMLSGMDRPAETRAVEVLIALLKAQEVHDA